MTSIRVHNYQTFNWYNYYVCERSSCSNNFRVFSAKNRSKKKFNTWHFSHHLISDIWYLIQHVFYVHRIAPEELIYLSHSTKGRMHGEDLINFYQRWVFWTLTISGRRMSKIFNSRENSSKCRPLFYEPSTLLLPLSPPPHTHLHMFDISSDSIW